MDLPFFKSKRNSEAFGCLGLWLAGVSLSVTTPVVTVHILQVAGFWTLRNVDELRSMLALTAALHVSWESESGLHTHSDFNTFPGCSQAVSATSFSETGFGSRNFKCLCVDQPGIRLVPDLGRYTI